LSKRVSERGRKSPVVGPGACDRTVVVAVVETHLEEQILDQDDLIIILEDSKKTSADITERLASAAVIEE
jgi:hypothetical protein